jgi:hypothetical protein
VPKYGFIGWSPSSGSWISEFGMVYAVYSNGRDPDVVAAEKAAKKKAQEQKKQKKQPPGPGPRNLPPIFPPR